jgi:hypothetical protein
MSDYSTDLESNDMDTFFSEEKSLIKKEDNTGNNYLFQLENKPIEVDYLLNCEYDNHNNFGQ